jgi:hypothetical protein
VADVPFTVMPIQMFNWVSRPGTAFQSTPPPPAWSCWLMTLAMNGLAIWLRYRAAQADQMVGAHARTPERRNQWARAGTGRTRRDARPKAECAT